MKTPVLDRDSATHKAAQRGSLKRAQSAHPARRMHAHARKASEAPVEFPAPELTGSEIETTRDSLVIRSWAEKRDGRPAIVKGGYSEEESSLWIDFPGSMEERDLEVISWDDWYERFLERNSLFEYQDKNDDGSLSTFFRVISS